MSRVRDLFRSEKPIVGVIHLPPLPGFAGSPGLQAVIARALEDLAVFEAGGVDGVLVENEEDHPHEVEAGPATIAHMTRIVCELAGAAPARPVGVEILLNDPRASLAVAAAAGARFIRTDYFVDRMERAGYGEMRIDAEEVMAYRRRLGLEAVLVLADLQVKYARMLEPRPLADSAEEACRHGADAVVITGSATGRAPSAGEIADARRGAAAGCPVLVGSGLDPDNAAVLLAVADGAIVGSSLKARGRVSPAQVGALMQAVRASRAAAS